MRGSVVRTRRLYGATRGVLVDCIDMVEQHGYRVSRLDEPDTRTGRSLEQNPRYLCKGLIIRMGWTSETFVVLAANPTRQVLRATYSYVCYICIGMFESQGLSARQGTAPWGAIRVAENCWVALRTVNSS